MKRTILVVDDNAVERAMLTDLLKDTYDIIEAKSGAEALSLLHSKFQMIAAVVLDLATGDTDGLELLQQLRGNPVFRLIPMIVTAAAEGKAQEDAAEIGANGFVSKPCSGLLLKSTLRNAILLRENAAMPNAFWRDNLTGLLNRESFFTEAERMLRRHEPGYYILSSIDVENFKLINDQYGTEKGDMVLRQIADCATAFFPEVGGIVCRVTADRFAALYPAALTDSQGMERLHAELMEQGELGRAIKVRIGRYLAEDFSLSISAMYDRATLAQESIKGRYDAFITYYDASMRERLLREQRIVNEMVGALTAGEFEPWLQPQYNHATGALIGAEALVRWHRDGAYITPDEFIPIFERNGFIYEMDRYIWEQVCRLLRRWLDEGREPLPVSVNISRKDLFYADFTERLTSLVAKYRIPYELLRLEVTESAFTETGIVAKVDELIGMGFIVEIDDFGSGYSSLNTLKDVPASILKLDMRFFERTRNTQRGGNIVESVVRMAKWLGMAVIAEGVEHRAQADYLRSIGCRYIQGYCYAKPMPVCEYEALLDSGAKEPKLGGLETLESLDNNEFWNPESIETLIFNSYVGGACIFEYHDGKTELLRVNERFLREYARFVPDDPLLQGSSPLKYLDEQNAGAFAAAIAAAIETRTERSCELKFSDAQRTQTAYFRLTLRVIASAGDRRLFYCAILNMTEQREAERRQLESARKLEIIMSNVNGGVSAIQIDDDGSSRTIFNNERYYELYGWTKAQAEEQQLDVMTAIVPEDIDGVLAKIRKLKADGQPAIIEYRVMKPDGRLAYLRANSSLMSLEGYGSVITSVVTDFTETRSLQDQLRAIVDNIYGGVTATVIRNGVPQFIVVNDRFFMMLGYSSREEFEADGMEQYSGLHPDDKARVKATFESSDGGKTQYSMEYRVVRRDGELRYIQNNIRVIRLFGIDEPVQLSVANDITELRMAQLREREAADKLSAVLNNAGRGITAIALRGDKPEFIFANDEYFSIVGYSREEYARVTAEDMLAPVHPDDREELRRRVSECNRKHGQTTVEYRVVRADGRMVCARSVITVTRLAGIDVPVQIGVFSDITAEREANDQLRFLNESAHDILAQPDSGIAIDRTLDRLLAYFAGDRAYVIELDADRLTTSNTYERCAAGVSSEQQGLREVPFERSDYWFTTLSSNQLIIVDDVNALAGERAALSSFLLAQGIRSLVAAPLRRDGELVGFVGIDNPKRATEQLERLRALGDYITILLTRRDLTERLERNRAAIQRLSGELLDNLPCGAALYEYKDQRLSAVHINRSYWELVGREPVDYSETSVIGSVHPDDRATVWQEIAAAIRQSRNAALNIRILCEGGAYRPFHIDARIAPEEGGGYMFFAAYTPISEQTMSVQEMIPIALSTVMSASEDYSYVKDRELRYICCSGSVARLLGLASPREIIGKTDSELFTEELAKSFAASDAGVIERGESLIGFMENIPGGNGGVRLANTSKYPLLDAAGNVIGLYGVSRDITTQHEKESQLELLTSSIPGGIAAYDITESGIRMLYFNDGFYKFAGCSREEYARIVEKDPLAFVLEEDKPALRKIIRGFAEHKTDGHVNGCVYRCRTKDGGYRWMSMKSVLSRITDSQFIVNIVQLDITEQKEAENQQKELLDNLPCGAGLYYFDGERINVVHVNRRYLEMVGRNTDQEQRGSIFDVIHPQDRARVRAILADGAAPEEPCDLRIRHADGSYHPYRVNSRMIKRDESKWSSCVTFLPIPEEKLSMQQMMPYIFPAMMESSNDITFAKDKSFRYLCCSHAYAKLLGLDDEKSVVGRTDYELFSNDIADQFRQDDIQLVTGGHPIIDKLETIPSGSGLPCYSRMSKYLLRDTLGNILGIYGVGRDITERQETRDQLRLLTDSIPGGLATFACTPEEYRLEYFNDGFCNLFGYRREEFTFTMDEIMGFINEDDRPAVYDAVAGLVAGCEPIDLVYRIKTRDGEHKWVSHNAIVADRVKGSAIVNAVFLDVTEQQEEKERLRVSEELNRLAIEHSGNIITRFDVYARTLTLPDSFNPIFELPHILENMPSEQIALGRVSPDTADIYTELFESIVRGQAAGSATYKQNSSKGWRWLEAQYTTVFSSTGKPVSAVISFTDITEQLEKEVVYNKWQQSLDERPEDSYTLFRCNLSKGTSFDSWEGKLLGVDFDANVKSFDERTHEYVEQRVYKDDRKRYAAFLNSDTMLAEYYRGHRSDVLEYREQTAEGGLRWVRLTVDLVEYPSSKDVEAYLMFENIDEQKKADLLTLERSEKDPLTGILNRATFIERMETILRESNGTTHALLMLDVDNFKRINDTLGHGAGDRVLRELTLRIGAILRRDDLIGRLGGDEFFVFLRDIPGDAAAAAKAKRICEMEFKSLGADFTVTASIGIAMIPRDGNDFDTLYKKADAALYRRKEQGKDGYLFVSQAEQGALH